MVTKGKVMSNLKLEEFAKACLINRTDNGSESNRLIDDLEESLTFEDFVKVLEYFLK